MTITFLGTGTSQGVPVIGCHCDVCNSLDFRDKRLRSSVFLEVDGKNLIIDTGPDFRQQVLRERIERVDAVLYTHEHKDHTGGMDDLRGFNYIQKEDIPVYGHFRVIEALKDQYPYAFQEHKYPGIPQIEVHYIEQEEFSIEDLSILPVEVLHHLLPVFGFRIGVFTYITDAKTITPEELEKVMGTKVLVINALQQKEHLSHLNLEEAMGVIDLVKPEKTYLTHLSHRMGLHRDVEAGLPENVRIAYDGLKINL